MKANEFIQKAVEEESTFVCDSTEMRIVKANDGWDVSIGESISIVFDELKAADEYTVEMYFQGKCVCAMNVEHVNESNEVHKILFELNENVSINVLNEISRRFGCPTVYDLDDGSVAFVIEMDKSTTTGLFVEEYDWAIVTLMDLDQERGSFI